MQYNLTYGNLINTTPVVPLALAKSNSNIDSDHEDDLLQLMLDAAVEEVEHYLGYPVRERSVTVQLSNWPSVFELPFGVVKYITAVSFKNASGVNTAVAVDNYKLYTVANADKVYFNWVIPPALHANNAFPITIECNVGWSAEEMPLVVKKAVLLRFSFNERYREEMPTSANRTFQAALRPLKKWG